MQRLGVGGMAEVYAARRVGPHGFVKRVALKCMLPDLAFDARFVEMFCDEARVMASLHHPNLVQVLDFGEAERTTSRGGARLFMALEYVDGLSCAKLLRAVAAKGKVFPHGAALYIASEVLSGLAYAHEYCDEQGRMLGLVHRDVSPGNILIGRTGEVKLTDFGILKSELLDRRTLPGELKGKLGYMSPEQVIGASIDARSDLFTLGIVLTEMLIGRPLFPGRNELDILSRIRDGDLGVLDRHGAHLPRVLGDLLRRALARDPRDRFPSAREFRREAHRAMAQLGLASSDSELLPWLHEAKVLPSQSGTRVKADCAPGPLERAGHQLPGQQLPQLQLPELQRGSQLPNSRSGARPSLSAPRSQRPGSHSSGSHSSGLHSSGATRPPAARSQSARPTLPVTSARPTVSVGLGRPASPGESARPTVSVGLGRPTLPVGALAGRRALPHGLERLLPDLARDLRKPSNRTAFLPAVREPGAPPDVADQVTRRPPRPTLSQRPRSARSVSPPSVSPPSVPARSVSSPSVPTRSVSSPSVPTRPLAPPKPPRPAGRGAAQIGAPRAAGSRAAAASHSGAGPARQIRLARPGQLPLGPLSLPRLLEMAATGSIPRGSRISFDGGPFLPVESQPALGRIVGRRELRLEAPALAPTWTSEIVRANLVCRLLEMAALGATGLMVLKAVVSAGERVKHIYFANGRPVCVLGNTPGELLGARLAQTGDVPADLIDAALQRSAISGRRLGEELVLMDVLRPAVLLRAVAQQVEERLLEAGRWRRGQVEFYAGISVAADLAAQAPDANVWVRMVRDCFSDDEIALWLSPLLDRSVVRTQHGGAEALLRATHSPEALVLEFADSAPSLRLLLEGLEHDGVARGQEASRALFFGLCSGWLRFSHASAFQLPEQ